MQPRFDFQENPSPIRFPGKFIFVWFPRKSMQNPPENQKKLPFFFSPRVFWICFRGLFAFVPLDLNFTNPKSTIFEPGWKTQHLPANHYQIASYVLFFLKKKKWTDFVSCARAGLVYREVSRKIGKNTDIFENYRNFRRLIGRYHFFVFQLENIFSSLLSIPFLN